MNQQIRVYSVFYCVRLQASTGEFYKIWKSKPKIKHLWYDISVQNQP